MENSLEVADWGDDDDVPQATEESTAGGVDADALSLASDDSDLEGFTKFHDRVWNDGHQTQDPPASISATQMTVESQPEPQARPTSPENPPAVQKPQKNEEMPLHPTLPPKPVAAAFTPLPTLTVSAEAMALPRAHARPNAEGRESSRKLPEGWEERKSSKGEIYYCEIETGQSQWEYPAKSIRSSRRDSREREGKRGAREGPPRRSRSKERRVARRSVSPRPQNDYKGRSPQGDSYRPARDRSPRGDPSRAPRDQPPSNRRAPSKERLPSPRSNRRLVDSRARSPGHNRDRDDREPRRERRPEPTQSSRHRPPSPRARSLERHDRSGPPARNGRAGMDIDRSEPPPPQGTRRQRSPDRRDTGDLKRRRLDLPPLTPGMDSYRPDPSRSARMDVDDAGHREEPRRATNSRNEPSRRERSPVVQPVRPRDDQIRVEIRHEITPARPQPPPSATEPTQAATAPRSRAPLPPQDQVMRDQIRQGRPPQGSEVNGSSSRSERAPTAPKADRGRGSGMHRQETDDRPPPRSDYPNARSDAPAGASNNRPKEREPAESGHHDRLADGGPPFGESSRGRGRHFATSGSNTIPIANPKGNFGGGRMDSAPHPNATNNNEKDPPLGPEGIQGTLDDKGRTRTSRFGPAGPVRDEVSRDKDRNLGENMVQIAIDVTTSNPSRQDPHPQHEMPPHLDSSSTLPARPPSYNPSNHRMGPNGPSANEGLTELPYDTPSIPSMEPLRISDGPADDHRPVAYGRMHSASPRGDEPDSMDGQSKGSLLARLGPGSGGGDHEGDVYSGGRKRSGRPKRSGRGGRR